jgi:hypothetical protein
MIRSLSRVAQGLGRVARVLIVLITTTVALGALGPTPTWADTGTWSAPIKIANGPDGWFPDVAADDAGRVYVVWQGSLPEENKHDLSALYYAGFDGHAWSTPNDIALISPAGHAIRSSILVDDRGMVDLIYKGLGAIDPAAMGQEDLWFKSADPTRASSPKGWSAPVRLTRQPQGYYSDLAMDSRGMIHAIWTESNHGSYGIYYAHSSDGGATWSERIPLDPSNPVWWYRAHIKVDGQDRVHVVWETLDPNALPSTGDSGTTFGETAAAYYAESSDGGNSWTTVKFLSTNGQAVRGTQFVPGPQQPSVGIDGQGHILLVFREFGSNRILYRESTDGVRWSDPTPIPGVTTGVDRPYDVYDMMTDSAGHVHLAMIGCPGGSTTMSLLVSEWDGTKWGAPAAVTGSPPYPEYPKLALSAGNRLHVVWFEGDRASVDRAPIGIWYSTALTTAPEKIRPLATPGAAVTPTAAVAATPRALATPVLAPIDATTARGADVSLRGLIAGAQESPAYPLFLGLIPVGVVWGSILLIRSARSRWGDLPDRWTASVSSVTRRGHPEGPDEPIQSPEAPEYKR